MEKGGERVTMRKYSPFLFILSILVLSGCATMSPRTKAGAKIGAILGGIGGAAIDKENPWRGAIEGAAAGAIIGGTIGYIIDQAALESARRDAPVVYKRKNPKGWEEEVVAEPKGISQDGNYKIVQVKYIRNGKVIKEEVKVIPLSDL